MVADVADGGVCSLLPWDLLCCTGLKEGGSQDLQILKKACLGNKKNKSVKEKLGIAVAQKLK